MQLHCRSCRAKILAEDANLDRMLAKCRACHAIFDFSDQIEGSSPPPPAKVRRDKGEIPMPKNLKVEEWGHSLTITRKWRSSLGCFFIIFALIWNGIVGTLMTAFLTTGTESDEMEMFSMLFFIPFVLVGLIVLYLALAFLLNRTTVRIENRELASRHGPFPWPGSLRVGTDDVEQLYCLEYVAYTQNHVPQYRFSVNLKTRDGESFPIVKGMEDPDHALFIENAIERHLGIEDRPVRGEVGG